MSSPVGYPQGNSLKMFTDGALPTQATSESAWAAACTPGGVLDMPGAAFPSSTPAA